MAIRDTEKKIDSRVLLLILSVSAVLTYVYFCRVELLSYGSRLDLHNQIIAGTAPSPYRYRILIPFVAEILTRALSLVLSAKSAFLAAYVMCDLASIFATLMMLFLWLKLWFSQDQALIGVLFIAGVMPITFQNHYFQPWSLLEPAFFSAALIAIRGKHYWILGLIMALASLNRETAVFIPLIFGFTLDVKGILKVRNRSSRNIVLVGGGLLLTWTMIFLGLRYFRGDAPHVGTIADILACNLMPDRLLRTFVNVSLFLGGFWFFSLFGFKHAPRFLKRVALVIPFYLITIMVWGYWYEVRMLMSLYPVLVPLGLCFLYPQEEARQSM